MIKNVFNLILLYFRALLSVNNAVNLSSEAKTINRFGRKLGWKLIWRMIGHGYSLLVSPISSFRYFEFQFALSTLKTNLGRCLDVSSPYLFSLYVSQTCQPKSIWIINPDKKDIRATAKIADKLNFANIKTDCCGVDILENSRKYFDIIWAISVIEHISGNYDDRYAVRLMYDALAAGGRLILTFPVDRYCWEEYRDQAYYGTSIKHPKSGKYFFQRYYDKAAIWNRLVEPIGVEPYITRWYGEKKAGHFVDYEKRWIVEGYNCSVDDPIEMSENYQEFSSWEMMPGKGVCGLAFNKTNHYKPEKI